MSSCHRYIPNWPFPPYIFIPGVNPHPKKESGHMQGLGDPIAPALDLLHPEKSDFLRFSLDLFNYRYFWESHVYFEALWNAHGRQGSAADFLKGMIKLGAAGVKTNVGQDSSAIGHFESAKNLFLAVRENEGPIFLGFDLTVVIDKIRDMTEPKMFEVHPNWK